MLGQARKTQRRTPRITDEEEWLRDRIVGLATQYGRYGYRRITALLNQNPKGRPVNHKKVERIWRMEGLKVPKKQPKRKRLWLNGGSCVRLRPQHKDYVWSYDFVMAWTADGKAFRILVVDLDTMLEQIIHNHPSKNNAALGTNYCQNTETIAQ